MNGHQVLTTISVMVNAACNLKCAHCDLPSAYDKYPGALNPGEWTTLIEKLTHALRPQVVSVAAMEPLLPKIGQPRTRAVLQAAKRGGAAVGLVTNAIYGQHFLDGVGQDLDFDFFDVSVDGPVAVNDTIRGAGHFAAANKFLINNANNLRLGRLFVSFTLTRRSAEPDTLVEFLQWATRVMARPRLVVLLLYPNDNVSDDLKLTDSVFARALDILAHWSESFEDIFLDIFPSSLPGLTEFIARGDLPGDDEVVRDASGLLWGHVAGNLFARYENRRDLAMSTLRVSPEGFALMPEAIEQSNYLTGAIGSLRTEDPVAILAQLARLIEEMPAPHPACQGRPCLPLCRSENARCPVLAPRPLAHMSAGDIDGVV